MEDKSQRTAWGHSYQQKCMAAILFHSAADLDSEQQYNLGTEPSKDSLQTQLQMWFIYTPGIKSP